MKKELTDFIGIYDSVMPPNICQRYIDLSRTASFVSRNDEYRTDKQLLLDSDFSLPVDELYKHTLVPVLQDYVSEFPYLNQFNFVSSAAILQITDPPAGGYHSWHGENMAWVSKDRILAWMLYLNDVPEGGETEFLYQGKRVQPRAGRVVIWPASFTHLHRGNPPQTKKYIITGWWQGDYGMRIIRKGK
tara:strand:- start:86 stop:652 length:567 start_codon:yes stop_codon:yes gene_type:complete